MRTRDRVRANFNPQIRRKNVKMSGGEEHNIIELPVQAAAMAMPVNVNDNACIVQTTFARPDLNIVLSYHR